LLWRRSSRSTSLAHHALALRLDISRYVMGDLRSLDLALINPH
jgi:hypothetical protein